VTGAQGQRWYEITVTGQAAHAGLTPMPRRRDPANRSRESNDGLSPIPSRLMPAGAGTTAVAM